MFFVLFCFVFDIKALWFYGFLVTCHKKFQLIMYVIFIFDQSQVLPSVLKIKITVKSSGTVIPFLSNWVPTFLAAGLPATGLLEEGGVRSEEQCSAVQCSAVQCSAVQ